MAQLHHAGVNGTSRPDNPTYGMAPSRFSDIPPAIDVPVSGGDFEEAVEINLEELLDDPTELCTLLENENVAKSYWITIALAYAKQHKVDHAIEMLLRALSSSQSGQVSEKLSLLSCLCWLYLCKSRGAPRVRPDKSSDSDVKTKDFYIQSATSTLNEASRISPSYPPLFLSRGVLYLLRSSLLPPAKSGGGTSENQERAEALRQASKCFDDALRASAGRNLMAMLGKAKVLFSSGKYAEALQGYQHVLERSPSLIDPDPRIGIGCCLWQLGHKEHAKLAWERSLQLNPESKIANILLGLYHLNISSQYPTSHPEFVSTYRTAMTKYTQHAFKLDERLPLTCATFAGYFLMRKAMSQVERLARRAIDYTNVNAIASDGWYLLARKEHYNNEIKEANEHYQKADQARGGNEAGYVPAKFGLIQTDILMQGMENAKFRLEKLLQKHKSAETMTLLGTLYAEEVFAAQQSNSKADKSAEHKKAIGLLESVRASWKDAKQNIAPDIPVLLNLTRLYENQHTEKALACLQQVEQLELTDVLAEKPELSSATDAGDTSIAREYLSPQLLNNMGCFHYIAERFAQARDLFQTALNACVRIADTDQAADTDALVTTITYNLARTYDAEGMLNDAKKVYEGLLERHEDYVEANARLTYISLRQDPAGAGPKSMQDLYQSDISHLEVRSLYGWYLNRAKRRTMDVAEDKEQRHYKHTLQQYDKYDCYSLTGMGNIYLTIAREMPRETDAERDKRHKMFERAVEFFDKVLQIDAKNIYAAQGIGIVLAEDKRDFGAAVNIFSQIRETMKDASVFINLGHTYCDLKQYSRAIENYEIALSKDRGRDAQLLTYLGRVWLLRGKEKSSLQAMKTSLDYSQRALDVAPDQIHYQFNVAFVQIQIAHLVYTLPETQRSLAEVEVAASGLDEAIEAFSIIAKSPNAPYPSGDIEQRANMGRNTMRRQLERAIQSQAEYERKNAEKLRQAREVREAELKKREEERRVVEEIASGERKKIAEERQILQERDRELTEKRAEEQREREDAGMSTDDDGGGRKRKSKRKASKRKKKGFSDDESDAVSSNNEKNLSGHVSGTASPASSTFNAEKRSKKKRRLEQRSKGSGKAYKSTEHVIDSDEEVSDSVLLNGIDKYLSDDEEATSIGLEMRPAEKRLHSPNGTRASPAAGRRRIGKVIDEDDDEEEMSGDLASADNHSLDGRMEATLDNEAEG